MLEKRGYQVDMQDLRRRCRSTRAWPAGKIDFETDSWLPITHAQYWKQYRKQLSDLGSWYGPTSEEIAVPSYVKGVRTLDDLQGPRRRSSTAGSSASNRAPARWTCSRTRSCPRTDSARTYQLTTGSTPSMLAELERDYGQKKPVAVALWSPHWAYDKYRLTKLADPKHEFGTGDQIHALGTRSFPDRFPKVAGWLKDFHLGEKDLTGLEASIQKAGQGNEAKGVSTWLAAHPGLVDELAPVGSTG